MIDRLRQGDKVLALLQEEYPEYHPLIGVARIAHSTEDERLQFDCHKTLCEYVEPKLKSVEVQQSFAEDSELRVVFDGEFEEVPAPPAKHLNSPPPQISSGPGSPVDDLLDSIPDPVKIRVGES
jgi:hypothetical protein